MDVVTTPAAAALLANHPAVRTRIPYDKHGAESGIAGMVSLIGRLRTANYDAAYFAQGSIRSAAIGFAARIGRRVGFDTSAGRLLYTERIAHRKDEHHAVRLWRLAAGNSAALTAEAMRPQLFPGASEREKVDRLLRDVPRDGAKLLALAPGSIWGTKRWPHFPALASRLAPLYRLITVGGAGDAPLAQEIASAAGVERIVDATGKLSLLESAELLRRCAALVTNDSAPLHLASAMGTPTVAIFGPTVPAFGFGPLAPRRAIAEVMTLNCRPCSSHGPQTCPLGHFKCMKDLDAQQVLDQVLALTA